MYANRTSIDSATSLSNDRKITDPDQTKKAPLFSWDFTSAKNYFSSDVNKLATISDEFKQALLADPITNVPSKLIKEIWSAFEDRTRAKKPASWGFVEFGAGNFPDDVRRFQNIQLVAKTAIKDRARSKRFGSRKLLHANEINFVGGRKFIASQCPTKLEQLGFLRMLVQHQVPLIVDLVSDADYASHLQDSYYSPTPNDNIKTNQDRSPTISRLLDYPTIQLIGNKNQAASKLYVEHLQIADGRVRPHSVRRLHFPNWPDHGVIAPAMLRALADEIEVHSPKNSRPILVHCRAGVGRTGTLISFVAARDIIRDAIKAGEPCNRATIIQTVLQVIAKSRLDRGPCFVQGDTQFKLIVDALMDEANALLAWENATKKNAPSDRDMALKGNIHFASQVNAKAFDADGNVGNTMTFPLDGKLPNLAIFPPEELKNASNVEASNLINNEEQPANQNGQNTAPAQVAPTIAVEPTPPIRPTIGTNAEIRPDRLSTSTVTNAISDSNLPFVKGKNVFDWALQRWSNASEVTTGIENRVEARKRIDDAWWHDDRPNAKLDLANLNLTSLPNCLIGINNLTELNLIGNPLKQLPDLREMKTLQAIYVSPEVKKNLEKMPLLLPPNCKIFCN